VPAEAATLAEALRAAGFRTAAFTANQLLVPGSGIEQGFETFGVLGPRRDEDRDLLVIEGAIEWVRQQPADARLFLWLHLIGPHLPYDPRPWRETDYATLFTDPDYAGEASGDRDWLDAAYAEGRALSGEDVEHVIALYDGELARVNDLVRSFLQLYAEVFEEQRSGRWDDTVLVLTGDHGEELHQRNRYWGHSKSVYSSVLHVPLVLRHAPSLTGRRVLAEVVELQDVMPTLLDWFGVPLPAGAARLRGRSLLPLVDSYVSRPFESRPAFGTWSDRIFTVRTDAWRLVWNPEHVVPEEEPPGPYPVPELALFDLARDPAELHDVAAEHPEVVAELLAAIRAWLASLDACVLPSRGITAERRQALEDLGYLSRGE